MYFHGFSAAGGQTIRIFDTMGHGNGHDDAARTHGHGLIERPGSVHEDAEMFTG
jgi:hypothetical protein